MATQLNVPLTSLYLYSLEFLVRILWREHWELTLEFSTGAGLFGQDF
jgi:hypothetical protein